MSIVQRIFGKREDVDFLDLVKKGALIIDVRSQEEFTTGHSNGAVNIPLNVLQENLDKVGDRDRTIITCCASGARSSVAVSLLKSFGYSNVQNGGGWQALQRKLSN